MTTNTCETPRVSADDALPPLGGAAVGALVTLVLVGAVVGAVVGALVGAIVGAAVGADVTIVMDSVVIAAVVAPWIEASSFVAKPLAIVVAIALGAMSVASVTTAVTFTCAAGAVTAKLATLTPLAVSAATNAEEFAALVWAAWAFAISVFAISTANDVARRRSSCFSSSRRPLPVTVTELSVTLILLAVITEAFTPASVVLLIPDTEKATT